MKIDEAAPRYGALLATWLVIVGSIALICAPVVVCLLLIAGAGR